MEEWKIAHPSSGRRPLKGEVGYEKMKNEKLNDGKLEERNNGKLEFFKVGKKLPTADCPLPTAHCPLPLTPYPSTKVIRLKSNYSNTAKYESKSNCHKS
jgi:hypothetical protein